jgi:hypothetical protein
MRGCAALSIFLANDYFLFREVIQQRNKVAGEPKSHHKIRFLQALRAHKEKY